MARQIHHLGIRFDIEPVGRVAGFSYLSIGLESTIKQPGALWPTRRCSTLKLNLGQGLSVGHRIEQHRLIGFCP